MKNNFDTVYVDDICKINEETYSNNENWEYVNYLDTGNITSNKIDTLQYIDLSVDKLPSRARRKVKNGNIIYSTVRPNQLHFGLIKQQPQNFLVSTGFAVLNIDTIKAIPEYIYYALTQKEHTEALHAIAEQSTSAYPSIKPSDIGNRKILLPELETQRKIAKVLSSIDDKIELNNSINKNLEQQAQAIFKSWFIDFDPFGGTMPEDWEYGTLTDIAQEIICGKTPSTSKKEYYGIDIPFITIPDMHNNTYVTKTERYLSQLGAESQKNKTLPPNSICVSCIATAGLVSLTSTYSQTNQQINSIIPKKEFSPYYLYLLLQSLSEKIIMLGSSGSTTCNLNKGQFAKIEIIIPDTMIIKNYHEIVKSLFEEIKLNQIENSRLTQLRDTLLPKLMNGEIDVDKVEV